MKWQKTEIKKEIEQVWLNTWTGNEIKIVEARPDFCAEGLIFIEFVNEKGQNFAVSECEIPTYIFSGGNKFTNSKNKTKVWSKAYEEYFSGIKIDKINKLRRIGEIAS